MGVYEGRGTLAKSLSLLQSRWLETKADWDDARAREFEKRFLEPLELDLRGAVSAMDQIAVVIARIHQECE
jgi:hypothetical protein